MVYMDSLELWLGSQLHLGWKPYADLGMATNDLPCLVGASEQSPGHRGSLGVESAFHTEVPEPMWLPLDAEVLVRVSMQVLL